ncbi:MAG: ImmA/IrrE family metallo-endopeptidase, partial [Nitriliruptorales bacterium]|nr:ImmA/IrrE family metallo-endopeptidase [Nitriliruptorales bacterium]
RQASYLSMIENGKREPRLSLIRALATALEVSPSQLLSAEAPDHRAQLEIELERAQRHRLYREMDLPHLKPSARVPDDVLEHLVRLFDELKSRARVRAATPEEARKGNAALRREMRERGNFFPEIEAAANEALTAIGYSGGQALSQRVLAELARHFGFSLHVVQEMPASVRSVTDLRHHRIYIPQRDEMESRNARSVVLQTLGHFALGHEDPRDFGQFLRQRVEANYFAGAVLVPERTAVPMLQAAKKARDLSIQDLEEVFNVSYEMAAHRFTNLATRQLGIPVHFTRSDEEGVIWKAYENDGVPFPEDPDGAIEGQRLCREWGTRQVFRSADKFALHYQYTDTSAGTYWCV